MKMADQYKGQDRFEAREELLVRHEEGGSRYQDGALPHDHPAFSARRRDRRADDLHAMVRTDRTTGKSRS